MQIKRLTADLYYMVSSMVTRDVYMHLINKEASVLCAWEMDKVKRKFEPIGALVYSTSLYSYNDKSNEILIESLFVKEACRRQGIGLKLLQEMERLVTEMEGINGLCVNIPMPELKNEASLFINNGFEHRLDGNVIYRFNKDSLDKIPFFVKIKKLKNRSNILPFNRVRKSELGKLYKMFDNNRLDKWLNPANYGGVIQNDLSFLGINDEKIEGFLATSLYPDGELYLGGIYVKSKDGMMVASLIKTFADSVRERKDIKKIIFAAATKEGKDLVDHILKDYEGEYWMQVESGFYKKIN